MVLRRLHGGARWGLSKPPVVGGLTSTTVHFPRALGTPAASCQPPLFAFARSFHLHLLPHYLLLIVSGESLSFCVYLAVSLSFSFSPSLFLSLVSFISAFLPVFPTAVEVEKRVLADCLRLSTICRLAFALSRKWMR